MSEIITFHFESNDIFITGFNINTFFVKWHSNEHDFKHKFMSHAKVTYNLKEDKKKNRNMYFTSE